MENKKSSQLDIKKLSIAIVAIVLSLTLAVVVAYKYSQKQSGNIMLPGGVTYTGPTATPQPYKGPTPTPVIFTAASDVTWDIFGGKIYSFQFSFPTTLPLVVFPGDPTDSVAIDYAKIPPQQNILLNVELIDKRDPSLLNKPKIEYVRNWYKFFPGLKGVAKVEPLTNTNGLKGYRALYINTLDQSPNTDVFFEIPSQPTLLIHLANGILEPKIFDRIVDSLRWSPQK